MGIYRQSMRSHNEWRPDNFPTTRPELVAPPMTRRFCTVLHIDHA